MPRDYAKRRPQKKRKKHSYSKSLLISLVIVVLLIVGLINFKQHNARHIHHAKTIVAPVTANNHPMPQFDFYTILPKEQVNVAKLSESTQSNTQYALQVSSVQNPADADHLRAELSLLGFDVYIEKFKMGDKIWNRVNIGPYFSATAAQTDQKRLVDNNIKSILKKLN